MLKFEWNEAKNEINRTKHGVWFEEARTVFDDPFGQVFADVDHSDDEDRFIIIGSSYNQRTLVVVHCYRQSDHVVRIISARSATKRERKQYEEGI